jgi:adenylylsulfate reductase, subunit B
MQIFVHDPKVDKVPLVQFPNECWHCNSCVLDCKEKAVRLRVPLAFMMLHVDCAQLNRKEGGK